MKISITVMICSLIYLIMVSIIYFSKQRINNIENKIYSTLLKISIIGLILEFGCYYFISNVDISYLYSFSAYIINKIFIIYLVTWEFIFTLYILLTSFYKNTKFQEYIKKYNKKISMIIMIIYVLVAISSFLLPLNYYNDGNYIYSYGPSTQLVFIAGAICIGIDIFCLIKNFKNITNKKYYPLFILIFFMIFVLIVRNINPGLTIINSVFAFVTILMYFTIENPDMKLISQLELAKNQADKANLAKSDFLSSMSHEIRTPLNAIVGFSECILENQTLEQAKSDAKDIIMASQNLLEIVNGVLDISKIEANKMEIINVDYDPNELFNNLVKLVSTRIGDKDLKLRTNIARDLPDNLFGDSGKVKEVVTNILTNAVKYTEKGFIDFNVNCINEKSVCKMIISVEDTGRGISPDKIDSLFTKFNRLDEDKNTSIEGTGLGLAITKSLVEMMGGKIVVQSKYGEGSKFTVYLSQKIKEKQSRQEEVLEETVDFSGFNVLLVDDNNMNLKIGTRMLEKYNLKVTQATSGQESINKIKEENYDILLLDDMMPKMSGTETMKKIKAEGKFKNPIVVLTANATNGMRETYLESGFDDYLSKPINRIELEKILNKYLQKK